MAKAISSHKQLISILVLGFLSFSSLISCTNSIQPARMEQMHITDNPDDIDNMLKYSKALRKRVRIQTRSIYTGLIAGALGIVGGAAYAIYHFTSPSPNTTNLSTISPSSNTTNLSTIGYNGTAVLPITTPSTYLATTLESVTERFENSSIDDILSSTPSTSSVNCPASSSAESNASSADLLKDFTRYLANNDLDKINEVIMDKNFNVNQQDEIGYTAFMRAVLKQQLQIAKLLFSCGADPMLLTQDGRDILILSVLNGDIDSVAFLLEIGLDPNRSVTSRHQPGTFNSLDIAVNKGQYKIAKILVNSGKTTENSRAHAYEGIKFAENLDTASQKKAAIYKKLLLQE